MSGRRGSTTTIRVAWEVRDDLTEEQERYKAEHRVRPTDSEMIAWMLEDRRAWRAMGEAALLADRKPVQP